MQRCFALAFQPQCVIRSEPYEVPFTLVPLVAVRAGRCRSPPAEPAERVVRIGAGGPCGRLGACRAVQLKQRSSDARAVGPCGSTV
jgi:hypothetical protein